MSLLLANNSGGSYEKLYSSDVFSTYLYTGNDSTQTITNEIDLSGKGGMVWTKGRGSPYNHGLVDTIRGGSNAISSQSTAAQWSTAAIASFNNNGYTLAPANIDNIWNSNFQTYVSWTFRRAEKFFDIVTYTGDGVAGRQIPHSLGVAPGMIIVKRTDAISNWSVWQRDVYAGNSSGFLRLDTTSAVLVSSSIFTTTAPTSAFFSVGSAGETNGAGGQYVAYLFAHDPSADGIIQCGSYVGTGAAQQITLGWEPQFVIIKRASGGTGDWNMADSMRGFVVGGGDGWLRANTSGVESSADLFDPTATGFNMTAISSDFNASGSTYIYLAIRRPNKPPTSGTQVYNAIARTGTGAAATVTGVGFPLDLSITNYRSATHSTRWYDRLRGQGKELRTQETAAEYLELNGLIGFDVMDGVRFGTSSDNDVNVSGRAYIDHFFRRAQGFFSTFAYTGTGTNRTTPHDLAAIPDLLIVKSRSAATDWQVWCNGLAANEKLVLNSNAGKVTDATAWNSTLPTSTNISLGTASATNANNATFIAYAFSNLPGIQKIGTYVGDGTSGRVIDCGFTTGARFVCIKAVSTTGSWLVSDTARGITSSTDPYLQLNSTEAEITTEDWLDPSSVGFIVNNVPSSNANASGVRYMYWAIS